VRSRSAEASCAAVSNASSSCVLRQPRGRAPAPLRERVPPCPASCAPCAPPRPRRAPGRRARPRARAPHPPALPGGRVMPRTLQGAEQHAAGSKVAKLHLQRLHHQAASMMICSSGTDPVCRGIAEGARRHGMHMSSALTLTLTLCLDLFTPERRIAKRLKQPQQPWPLEAPQRRGMHHMAVRQPHSSRAPQLHQTPAASI